MKYLILVICLFATVNAMAFARSKTCTCYSGWSCTANAAGGMSCSNTGYSWSQSSTLPCSNANAYDGTVSWASWDSYSPGAGQPYSTPLIFEQGSGGTGSDVLC